MVLCLTWCRGPQHRRTRVRVHLHRPVDPSRPPNHRVRSSTAGSAPLSWCEVHHVPNREETCVDCPIPDAAYGAPTSTTTATAAAAAVGLFFRQLTCALVVLSLCGDLL